MIAISRPAQPVFESGQLVRHRRYGYRGVVVDRDEFCQADDEWYSKNQTQPNRDQPWYHVLVDGSLTLHLCRIGKSRRRFERSADRAGHQVTIANTGEDALAALKSDAFDIVLMDVEMPDMDGLEATQQIRHIESLTGQHTPIIGLTTIERDRCLSAGMDGHLQKPATPKQLWETIRRFLHAA